jgi:plasmid stabilization system protein ParE
MDLRVVFSPTSIQDLSESVSYISRFNPAAAARIGDGLIDEAESFLSRYPYGGPVCPEFPDVPYRYWLHRNYRIVYQVNESPKCVEVLRFWHCSRGDAGAQRIDKA